MVTSFAISENIILRGRIGSEDLIVPAQSIIEASTHIPFLLIGALGLFLGTSIMLVAWEMRIEQLDS